jgi:hypothetical protein
VHQSTRFSTHPTLLVHMERLHVYVAALRGEKLK